MQRHVVLFAREPGREAQEKGFTHPEARELFARLAGQWREGAKSVGARLVVASPPEDRLAWRRCLGPRTPYLWIGQRGTSFGQRLENSARAAGALPGHSVIVGGDVVPSASALAEAFTAMEAGADAVLAAAPDGGVSLLALRAWDVDLLRAIAPRRRDVFALLRARLLSRGRRVLVIAAAPDVDGRRGLRALLASDQIVGPLRAAARRALERSDPFPDDMASFVHPAGGRTPVSLRGPPAAA
ncbi:MAG: DUF2064 domain-containing protein [Acidobacteriota bacterium]